MDSGHVGSACIRLNSPLPSPGRGFLASCAPAACPSVSEIPFFHDLLLCALAPGRPPVLRCVGPTLSWLAPTAPLFPQPIPTATTVPAAPPATAQPAFPPPQTPTRPLSTTGATTCSLAAEPTPAFGLTPGHFIAAPASTATPARPPPFASAFAATPRLPPATPALRTPALPLSGLPPATPTARTAASLFAATPFFATPMRCADSNNTPWAMRTPAPPPPSVDAATPVATPARGSPGDDANPFALVPLSTAPTATPGPPAPRPRHHALRSVSSPPATSCPTATATLVRPKATPIAPTRSTRHRPLQEPTCLASIVTAPSRNVDADGDGNDGGRGDGNDGRGGGTAAALPPPSTEAPPPRPRARASSTPRAGHMQAAATGEASVAELVTSMASLRMETAGAGVPADLPAEASPTRTPPPPQPPSLRAGADTGEPEAHTPRHGQAAAAVATSSLDTPIAARAIVAPRVVRFTLDDDDEDDHEGNDGCEGGSGTGAGDGGGGGGGAGGTVRREAGTAKGRRVAWSEGVVGRGGVGDMFDDEKSARGAAGPAGPCPTSVIRPQGTSPPTASAPAAAILADDDDDEDEIKTGDYAEGKEDCAKTTSTPPLPVPRTHRGAAADTNMRANRGCSQLTSNRGGSTCERPPSDEEVTMTRSRGTRRQAEPVEKVPVRRARAVVHDDDDDNDVIEVNKGDDDECSESGAQHAPPAPRAIAPRRSRSSRTTTSAAPAAAPSRRAAPTTTRRRAAAPPAEKGRCCAPSSPPPPSDRRPPVSSATGASSSPPHDESERPPNPTSTPATARLAAADVRQWRVGRWCLHGHAAAEDLPADASGEGRTASGEVAQTGGCACWPAEMGARLGVILDASEAVMADADRASTDELRVCESPTS